MRQILVTYPYKGFGTDGAKMKHITEIMQDNCSFSIILYEKMYIYEGESISNQPNLFRVEIYLFFYDAIAL